MDRPPGSLRIAGVADQVLVRVLLARIGDRRAVVGAVGDPVFVVVGIAGVTDEVAVEVISLPAPGARPDAKPAKPEAKP